VSVAVGQAIGWLNLALAFVLEVVAWVVLAVAASLVVDGTVARLVVGVAAFAVVTTLWGLLASPRARVPAAVRTATKVVVLGGAAAAWAVLGHPVAGAVLAVLVVANLVVLRVVDPSAPSPGDDDRHGRDRMGP
jgi:4-amino-4-deoxy-L-arabinose transferase-like glycosyltransferase